MVDEGRQALRDRPPPCTRPTLDRAEGTVAAGRGARRAAREGVSPRQEPARPRLSISQEEYDRYEADYDEAEANLEVAMANRDLARLEPGVDRGRRPDRRPAQPPHGRPRQPDQGRRHGADLDRQPGSALRLLRRPRAGHAQDQAADRSRASSRSRPRGEGSARPDRPVRREGQDVFPHQGVVDFTDNRVDLNTGTLRFRAKIDNPADINGNRFIVPGLFVKVRLPIGDPHPALMIREQALVSPTRARRRSSCSEGEEGRATGQARPRRTRRASRSTVVAGARRGDARRAPRRIPRGRARGSSRAIWVVVAGMQRLRPGIEVKPEKYDEKPDQVRPPRRPSEKPATAKPPASPSAKARRPQGRPPGGADGRRRPTLQRRQPSQRPGASGQAPTDPTDARERSAAPRRPLAPTVARGPTTRISPAAAGSLTRSTTTPDGEPRPCSPASSSTVRSSPRSCRS